MCLCNLVAEIRSLGSGRRMPCGVVLCCRRWRGKWRGMSDRGGRIAPLPQHPSSPDPNLTPLHAISCDSVSRVSGIVISIPTFDSILRVSARGGNLVCLVLSSGRISLEPLFPSVHAPQQHLRYQGNWEVQKLRGNVSS